MCGLSRIAMNAEHVLQRIHLLHDCTQLNATVQIAPSEAFVSAEHPVRLAMIPTIKPEIVFLSEQRGTTYCFL